MSEWRPADARGPHPGRDGTGKELVARASAPPLGARERARSSSSTARPSPSRSSRASSSATSAARSPTPREQKRGLVELADGGTLFLDEIGDLAGSAQAKLLRFVEAASSAASAARALLSVDCRIVAATHQRSRARPTRSVATSTTGSPAMHHHAAAPPRARRGRARCWRAISSSEYARQYRKPLEGFTPEARGAAAEPSLAGERARAQDRHRVGRGDG